MGSLCLTLSLSYDGLYSTRPSMKALRYIRRRIESVKIDVAWFPWNANFGHPLRKSSGDGHAELVHRRGAALELALDQN